MPGLQGAGWTAQLLTTWTEGMAGAQWDLGLSKGTMERQFTSSCYPRKHQHGGFPKFPLFLRLNHLPADFQRPFMVLVPSQILQRAEQRVTDDLSMLPESSDLLVFKGGSSHTQRGEEPGLFLA